jgi:DNA repair protein RecO (recombination protein O)
VKGGASRSKRPFLDPGNLVAASWRARLSEQLGHFQVEPLRAIPAVFLDDAARLSALTAACATMEAALPEREPHGDIYDDLTLLIATLERNRTEWPAEFVRWEARLLSALGSGLDLTRCALTGATEDLAFVSPKSGRAAGKPVAYRETAGAAALW